MSKQYVIGHDQSSENSNEFAKKKRAKYLQEKVIPVIKFLDDHGIDYKTVNSYAEIVAHFKDKFPFPNAPDARNFELMGIDVSPIREANQLRELNTDFYIDGNEVKIKPEWYEANKLRATFYTRTESEDKAYEFANELIELLQRGHKEGFISNEMFRKINRINDLVYLSDGTVRYVTGGIREAGRRHDKKMAVVS